MGLLPGAVTAVRAASAREGRNGGSDSDVDALCRSERHRLLLGYLSMKARLLAPAVVSAVALVPAAQSSAGPLTTNPPPVITIKIFITDTAIRMSPKRGQRGVMARFILVNLGKKPHTFSMGHEKRGQGVQTGFNAPLKPNQQSIHIYFLDYRGKLPYFGSLPGDRSKPAMKGVFTIF